MKWSALFFLPSFAVLIIVWRLRARRSAGLRGPFITGAVGDLGWGLLSFVLAGIFCLATWTGWFVTDTGYFRHYREANGRSEPPVLGALFNLMHYHQEAYGFHSGLTQRHPYQSWPWQWLLLGRPVSFYWPGTTVAVGVYVAVVAVCFAYFFPIFVGQLIPYESWPARMWLGGRWI